jgi:PHD/YefM family antitoxin component YafN of YafNO toxin-antitoxin module
MTRTISPPELKNNLDGVLRTIREERGPYVIETEGERAAILLSPEEYDELRREWAWGVIDQLGKLNADRDPDDIYEEVTKVVEEVRQESYDEWRASTRGPRHQRSS